MSRRIFPPDAFFQSSPILTRISYQRESFGTRVPRWITVCAAIVAAQNTRHARNLRIPKLSTILSQCRLSTFTLLRLRGRREVLLETHRRIIVHDSSAALAEHHLVAVSQVLIELRPQHDLARGAAPFHRLGKDRAVPLLPNPLIGAEHPGL